MSVFSDIGYTDPRKGLTESAASSCARLPNPSAGAEIPPAEAFSDKLEAVGYPPEIIALQIKVREWKQTYDITRSHNALAQMRIARVAWLKAAMAWERGK